MKVGRAHYKEQGSDAGELKLSHASCFGEHTAIVRRVRPYQFVYFLETSRRIAEDLSERKIHTHIIFLKIVNFIICLRSNQNRQMIRQYFIQGKDGQQGPFSIQELKSKQIGKDTPVWHNGLEDWTIAGYLEELKEEFVVTPPPFARQDRQANAAAHADDRWSPATPKTKSNRTARLILLIALILGVILAINLWKDRQQETVQQNSIRENIANYVSVETGSIKIKGLGGIGNLSVVVSNTSSYKLDLVRVRIDYIKDNGGIFKSEYLDFNSINAEGRVILNAPDSRRGTSVNYSVVAIKSYELGL